jgi:hypothetical protein
VSTAATLFQQGLADPRGCEYRAIDVTLSDSVSGYPLLEKRRGWVLPGGSEGQRFAILWDGLVYPIAAAGEPVELKAEVRASLARVQGLQQGGGAASREDITSFQVVEPLGACLLLRLGEAELARRVWQAATRNQGAPEAAGDPYLQIAGDWLWALFDRAVGAHMSGHDALALLSARALTRLQPMVEAEAVRRGLPRPQPEAGAGGGDKVPYFDFLGQLPDLLADQERRAREPQRESALLKGIGRFPTRQERIAALIDDLKDVAERQMGEPGGVAFENSAVVTALIRQGDAAVEPLLDCLEKDPRLTRSVHYRRSFHRSRHILGVQEPAYTALAGILRTHFFGVIATGDDLTTHGLEGRRQVAAAMRAYWNRSRGLPLAERWYRALLDDQAGPKQWLQAADNLVQPVDEERLPSAESYGWWRALPGPRAAPPRLAGEALRASHSPSVAELLARRIASLARPWAGSDNLDARVRMAGEMALDLADWDPKAAVPVLQAQMRRCLATLIEYTREKDTGIGDLARLVAQLAVTRARAKDRTGLEEYARWVRTAPPNRLAWGMRGVLEPLWRYPDDPAMVQLAAALFGSPRSPWLWDRARAQPAAWYPDDLLQSALLGVPGFRRHALANLADRAPADPASTAPLVPPAAHGERIRRCDVYAYQLSLLDGTPLFEMSWPRARRDAAIAALAAFLRRYGDRFRHTDLNPAPWEVPHEVGTRMSFPRLERPATAAEVRQGRAIFSLEGQGPVRRVKLPAAPIEARWITLKKYPIVTERYDWEKGRMENSRSYDQEGQVWQAEEVLRNGRWERFYGFVGTHDVARVPAAAIEFPSRGDASPLPGKLEARVSLPEGQSPGGGPEPLLEMGKPIPMTLWLRNRSGLDQTVPRTYLRPPAEAPALRAAIEAHLDYSPLWPESERLPNLRGAPPKVKWEEVPARPHARFSEPDAGRVLGPGEEFAALEVDLNRWFDLRRPGFYRLRFTLLPPLSGSRSGPSREAILELGVPASP